MVGASLSLFFQNCSDVNFSSSGVSKVQCAEGESSDLNGDCHVVGYRTTTITVQTQARQVDLMLVIDDSGSMKNDNDKLSQKLSGFVALLQNSAIDWQACYTTTTVGGNTYDGRALKWKDDKGANTNDIVLNPQSAGDVSKRLQLSIGSFSGNGSGNEQGIHAMGRALERSESADCFRQGSALAMIVISDEDEASCGGRCQNGPDEITMTNRADSSYANQYRALVSENSPEYLINAVKDKFGPTKNFLAHSLVINSRPDKNLLCYHAQDSESPAFYGITYENLSILTGGIIGNICSDDYSIELANIATRIDESLASITLECSPVDQAATVTLVPLVAGQQYKVQGNKLIFTPSLAAGTKVTATYKCFAN